MWIIYFADVKAAGMKIGVTQGEATETEMTDIVVDIKTPEMHHMNEAETIPNPLTVIAAATEIAMMVTEKKEIETVDATMAVIEDANHVIMIETDAVSEKEVTVENVTAMTAETETTETPEEATSIDRAKET